MTIARKKILYIVEADLTSGSGRCAIELIQSLKEKTEYTPIVITNCQNSLNKECDKLSIENHSVHYARTCSFGMGYLGWLIALICRPFLNLLAYKKISRLIDFKSVCLIHSNSSSIDFGAYLHHKTHTPHIWHIREFLVFDHLQLPIIHNLPNYIARNSSCIITVSNKLKNFIQERTRCDHIKTIYDGVYSTSDKIVHNPNNGSCKFRLVCVGNLTPIKGQDTLLKAISLLPTQILNNISIDFYGSNSDGFENKLKSIAKKSSFEHIVSFKGFCTSILEILSNYDIGIQPSHTEGFSRVSVEYMLAGLCVIGNGDTAIQELIEDGHTGFLYNDFDIQSLADKISYCFYNRNEIKQIGQRAQKIALEKYCIEKNFQKIVNEYRQIEKHI